MGVVVVLVGDLAQVLEFVVLGLEAGELVLVLFDDFVDADLLGREGLGFVEAFLGLGFLLKGFGDAQGFAVGVADWGEVDLDFFEGGGLDLDTFGDTLDLFGEVLVLESKEITLFDEAVDELVLLVHLDCWFVLDVHGSGCVVEGGEGFIEVHDGGGHASDHQSLGCSS